MKISKYLNYLFENILDFPSTRQYNTVQCGPSSVQSILQYYGIDEREDTIARDLKTNEDGTHPNNIINYFKNKGFKVIFKQMTIEEVKKFIEKKIPVILLVQAWADDPSEYNTSLDNGHYIVARGFDDNVIFFNDPSIYSYGYLTDDELKKRWVDVDYNGKKYVNFGIAVYGKDPVYNSKIAKKIK